MELKDDNSEVEDGSKIYGGNCPTCDTQFSEILDRVE